jgi:rhodanese-related sulfurtransferase
VGDDVTMNVEVPQIDPTEASTLIANGAVLLDVREDDEWAAGRSASARHIRLAEVPERIAELPEGTTIVAVCRAGGRSQQAAEFLRAQNIDAVNLTGGMRAWAAAGLDVVTESGDPGTVI